MAVGGGTDTYGGAELLSIGGGAQFTSGVEAGERPAVSAELASSGGETQLISGEELLPAVAGTPSPAPEGEGYFKDHELPKFYPEYTLYPTGKGVPFYKYRTVQVAVPLVVAGGLMFGNDVGFRDMRNDFLGPWRYHYDDYLQYSSAAILVGLKAFGMKGRSSWGRMLTSSAFAVVGTVLMTNGTKLPRCRSLYSTG